MERKRGDREGRGKKRERKKREKKKKREVGGTWTCSWKRMGSFAMMPGAVMKLKMKNKCENNKKKTRR